MSKLRGLGEKAFNKLVPKSIRPHIIHKARWTFTEIERRVLHGGRDLPIAVNIETNSICTKTCYYCSRPSDKDEILDKDIVYSIIDQLKDWGFKGRISHHSYNEPLTDNRIYDFIKYTKRHLLFSEIVLYTNGDLLNAETTDKLVKSGVVEIKVTLHEPTSRKLETRIIALKEQYHLITIIDRRVEHRSDPLFNRGGSIVLKDIKKFKGCYYIEIMVIRSNGNVILCCQDAKGDYIFGNVKEKSLESIWNNPKFVKLRKDIRTGKYELPICQMCGYE
jgi:radical SAM protein with 4Fe4S-binding SPASM domain